jgi:acyl dehydratase
MQNLVGKEYPPFTVAVERRWIRTFARAIGDDDPVAHDVGAARAAGYPDLAAPPTFAFTVAMEAAQPLAVIDDLGVDKTRTMHGEQRFRFQRPIVAGDVLTGQQKIVDIYERKGGALVFVITETQLRDERDAPVCELRTIIVVRNG